MSPSGRGPHVPGNQSSDAKEFAQSCAIFAVVVFLAVAAVAAAFIGFIEGGSEPGTGS